MKITVCKKLAVAFLTSFAFANAAAAHAKLDSADPAAGSTVSSSPTQVTMHFTEELEPKFSGAEVDDAGGTRVDAGSSVSGSTMRVGLKALKVGTYTVQWHALSLDTHKTHGSFKFHVGK
ncbi:MAG: copper homeostasis periplasmic binding protein CopC [Proteobacteria bacterium]|nr:copper homeostasis periplasmic binding protein CopC [Pseudomonadota bacterium]